jgi:DNA mismatch endonuclease, patch repair protein
MKRSRMAPTPVSPASSSIMRGNRGIDTRPERRVRSLLHADGLRFRKNYQLVVAGLRVKPDIVFTRHRLAVFVDGCFWHNCPEHGTSPRANSWYWALKLARNKARDERVNEALRDAGWMVLRIWEHQDSRDAADEINRILGGLR